MRVARLQRVRDKSVERHAAERDSPQSSNFPLSRQRRRAMMTLAPATVRNMPEPFSRAPITVRPSASGFTTAPTWCDTARVANPTASKSSFPRWRPPGGELGSFVRSGLFGRYGSGGNWVRLLDFGLERGVVGAGLGLFVGFGGGPGADAAAGVPAIGVDLCLGGHGGAKGVSHGGQRDSGIAGV